MDATRKDSDQPRKRPATRYLLATDRKEVDREFYTLYAARALCNKVVALAHALENAEGFAAWASAHPELADYPIDDRYFESLRTEMYLTEFHQFEAFFTLLIAPFQRLPAWIYLTAYKTNEFTDAVDAYLAGHIGAITNGLLKDKDAFARHAVYTGVEPVDEDLRARWAENIANVIWLIDRFATHYVEGRDEYNAYKHGLRVLTGESTFSVGLESSPGGPVKEVVDQFASPDSVMFLQFQQAEPGLKTVRRIVRQVNPWVSVFSISKMSQMAETARMTRLAAITGSPVTELATQFHLDRDLIAQEEQQRNFQAIYLL